MSSRLPPLNALRAFEAAARHLSFKKAADELYVTPAAISHQIKTLEDHLNVRLFHRGNRALTLTPVGEVALDKLQAGFNQLLAAVEDMRNFDATPIFTVNVTPSFANKFLMPRLYHFVAQHPDIEVRINASTKLVGSRTMSLLQDRELGDVEHGNIDVAVRFGSGDFPGFEAEQLFPGHVAPLCSPLLLQDEQPLRQPADLARHTLLHVDPINQFQPRSYWDVWLEEMGLTDAVDSARGIHFSHAYMAIEAAINGLGVAITHTMLAAADIAAGRLLIPFRKILTMDYSYYLIYSPETAESPNFQAFRHWLCAEIARMPRVE